MKNVEAVVKGNKLCIVVDIDKVFGPSSSGKTIIIGSSEGNQEVPGHAHIKFGVNVYKKA